MDHDPAVLINHTNPTTMATAAIDPPPKAAPLRRATYVNVDHLVRSQYDIDLQRLTDELAKLKAPKNNEPSSNSKEAAHENDGDGGDAKEGGAGSEGAGSSAGGKPNAWSGTNLSVLPGGPLRSPLPHAKYHHQSRLQPPRDGFNLCL